MPRLSLVLQRKDESTNASTVSLVCYSQLSLTDCILKMEEHPVDLGFDYLRGDDFQEDIYGGTFVGLSDDSSPEGISLFSDIEDTTKIEGGLLGVNGSDLSSPFSSPYNNNDGGFVFDVSMVEPTVAPTDLDVFANFKPDLASLKVVPSTPRSIANVPGPSNDPPATVGKKRGRPKKVPRESKSRSRFGRNHLRPKQTRARISAQFY